MSMTDNWIEVCALDDIPRLGSRVIERSDGNIAVFRTDNDKVFALDDRCPHKGGPLSQGIVFDNRVACPMHDWVIDLESGQACGPDEGCTHAWPVKLEAGKVFIILSKSEEAAA